MPSLAVAIPTLARPEYLDVALGSVMPQARARGAPVLVVDDGPSAATRAVAERHGASYVAHASTRGLNAARNTALSTLAHAELVCFLDDDVRVRPGWLGALARAAAEDPGADVLTGPIVAVFEGHRFRTCGREGPPVTHLDLGPADCDAPHAWGANMAVRRAAVERIGPFDESLGLYGDEQEWQARLHAEGGRIRYVAGAALEHRRAGDDARLRSLMRAARARGRAGRREDVAKGVAPGLGREAADLLKTAAHGARFACMNGPVLTWHLLGRVQEALRPAPATDAEDFLSGASGTVGGRRLLARRGADAVLDVSWRRGPARGKRRTVLVLGIERPGSRFPAAREELERSAHDVHVRTGYRSDLGKFGNLIRLWDARPVADPDWLLVVDDDVVLPRGFLDRFLALAEHADLRLAQPAHRLASHAAWPVTRRRPLSLVRQTRFVEIGPVTAFHRSVLGELLPFPDLRMGWGLDAHWAAVAEQRGWPVGVVDATPILHTAPAAVAYGREEAIAEARAFLAERPYLGREQAARTLRTWR